MSNRLDVPAGLPKPDQNYAVPAQALTSWTAATTAAGEQSTAMVILKKGGTMRVGKTSGNSNSEEWYISPDCPLFFGVEPGQRVWLKTAGSGNDGQVALWAYG